MTQLRSLVPLLVSVHLLLFAPGGAAAQRESRVATPPEGDEQTWPNLFVTTADGGSWLTAEYAQVGGGISGLDTYTVSGRSEELRSAETLMGRQMLIGVRVDPTTFRYFRGIVNSVTISPGDSGDHAYEIRAVPWLSLLRYVATCAVFEELTIPQILERVFSRHRFADYELRLGGHYPPRALEVQYRETDLNFVRRLLEHEGIYPYFEHTATGHKLILTDGSRPRPRGPAMRVERGGRGQGVFTRWSHQSRLQPTRYTLAEHIYEGGAAVVTGTATIRNRRGGELEIFDYPGEYRTRREANRYAQLRRDELRTRASSYTGWTLDRRVRAGQVIQVDGQRLLVTTVSMSVDASRPGSGEVSVSAVPANRPYRPTRSTPKPMISGVQSATVSAVEEGGFGRVRVRFHWDRSLEAENGAWLRVVQPVSGGSSPRRPRVGQEVLVAFREGDPNRPVVVGLLYADAARRDAGWPESGVESLR